MAAECRLLLNTGSLLVCALTVSVWLHTHWHVSCTDDTTCKAYLQVHETGGEGVVWLLHGG